MEIQNGVTISKIKLALIDDHPIVGLGVQMAIKKNKANHIEFCETYESGQTALTGLATVSIDVLIVDILLPDISGIELITKLLRTKPTYQIGVYSSIIEKDLIIQAFDNGAIGFLPKNSNSHEIIDFISTLAKGEMYLRGEIAKIMLNYSQPLTKPKKYIQLTPRERDVFQLIVNGFKTKEIAHKLNIAERTVEFHKQNLYLKFDVSNAVNLTQLAMRGNTWKNYDLGMVTNTVVPIF